MSLLLLVLRLGERERGAEKLEELDWFCGRRVDEEEREERAGGAGEGMREDEEDEGGADGARRVERG